MSIRTLALKTTIIITTATLPILAQQMPDAGQIAQELTPPLTLPEQKRVSVVIDTPVRKKSAPGGQKVTINSIVITGNSIFSNDELLTILGDFRGKQYDLAGLEELTERITSYYKNADYPFAKALIPAQKIDKGHLQIKVVEGRYDKITIGSKHGVSERMIKAAGGFLDNLKTGEVIKGKILERATLILENQPGYNVLPIIRPGQKLGSGDFSVELIPAKQYGGTISFDNYGDRHTGRNRGSIDLYANSPFMFGDQINLTTIYTDEDLWFGTANYNLPIGTSGLRGQIGFSRVYYEIGKEFSLLDASGIAKIASTSFSYPILRSRQANLLAFFGYQRKWLNDRQKTAGRDNDKSSHVLPIGFNFDVRDQLFGNNSITYGMIGWSHGFLDLDDQLKAIDRVTARTDGRFGKLNFDVARIQGLPANFMFFARFTGQLAQNNLDSSERFGLGGVNGVRAYPVGEGFGDEGWITQLELRYRVVDPVTPYVFYDFGSVRINHDTWTTTSNNRRSISGIGFGVRGEYKGLKADLSLAWSAVGGNPQSDSTIKNNPIIWFKMSYSF